MSVSLESFECEVMEWDFIKEIVPKEAAAIEDQLAAVGADINEFCRAFNYKDYVDADIPDTEIGEWHERLWRTWDELADAFTRATTVEGHGLSLTPEYHESDFEDAIAYFAVDGVFERTPAGTKFFGCIWRKHFTGIE